MWKFCYYVLIQNGVSVGAVAWKPTTRVSLRVEEVGGIFQYRQTVTGGVRRDTVSENTLKLYTLGGLCVSDPAVLAANTDYCC